MLRKLLLATLSLSVSIVSFGQSPSLSEKTEVKQESPNDTEFVYWKATDEGCSSEYSDGRLYRTIKHKGLTIAVTLAEEDKMVAWVGVKNEGDDRVNIMPQSFWILAIQRNPSKPAEPPKIKELKSLDPVVMVEKGVRRARMGVAITGALAAVDYAVNSEKTVTTEGSSSGSFTIRNNRGQIAEGEYSGTSTTSTRVKDPAAERRLAQTQRNLQAQLAGSQRAAAELLEACLKANTLQPGSEIGGLVFFTSLDKVDLT